MANQPVVGSSAPYMDATAMGPVQAMHPTDLYDAGEAPDDVRYTLAPMERDLWQFTVDQAGPAISACAAAGDTVTGKSYDGPYDCATIQPDVPIYGMAGG